MVARFYYLIIFNKVAHTLGKVLFVVRQNEICCFSQRFFFDIKLLLFNEQNNSFTFDALVYSLTLKKELFFRFYVYLVIKLVKRLHDIPFVVFKIKMRCGICQK